MSMNNSNSTTYSGYTGKERTNSAAEWNRPTTVASREEKELMTKSAHELESATDPLQRLRLICLSRGASGILVLGRVLRRLDTDDRRVISRQEFASALKHAGIDFTDQEADELFSRFEVDNTNTMNIDEFVAALRPPLPESRHAIVEQAFQKCDRSGSGRLTIEDLRHVYSVNCSPRYMSGEDSGDFTMNKFLDLFMDGNQDGTITINEFLDYYSGVSVAIEHDSYFDLMMRQCYKL